MLLFDQLDAAAQSARSIVQGVHHTLNGFVANPDISQFIANNPNITQSINALRQHTVDASHHIDVALDIEAVIAPLDRLSEDLVSLI